MNSRWGDYFYWREYGFQGCRGLMNFQPETVQKAFVNNGCFEEEHYRVLVEQRPEPMPFRVFESRLK